MANKTLSAKRIKGTEQHLILVWENPRRHAIPKRDLKTSHDSKKKEGGGGQKKGGIWRPRDNCQTLGKNLLRIASCMGYIRRKKRNCSNFLRPFFPFFSRICATSCALEMSFLLSCVGKRKAPSIFTSPGLPYKSSFFPERKYSKGTFLVCLVNCD